MQSTGNPSGKQCLWALNLAIHGQSFRKTVSLAIKSGNPRAILRENSVITLGQRENPHFFLSFLVEHKLNYSRILAKIENFKKLQYHAHSRWRSLSVRGIGRIHCTLRRINWITPPPPSQCCVSPLVSALTGPLRRPPRNPTLGRGRGGVIQLIRRRV